MRHTPDGAPIPPHFAGAGAATYTAETTEPLLGALNSSVRTAREQLELALLALADDPKRFEQLKKAWGAEAKAGSAKAASLRAACSTTGAPHPSPRLPGAPLCPGCRLSFTCAPPLLACHSADVALGLNLSCQSPQA